jgi:hypothetical protein
MPRHLRKISIGQAVKQGDTVLTIWCLTPKDPAALRRGEFPLCHHKSDVPVDALIQRYGAEASLSDVKGRCGVCGGTVIDVLASPKVLKSA